MNTPTITTEKHTKSIQLRTCRLVFDEYGAHNKGPALLALHGIPGWRGNWSGVASVLATDYRLIAPDLAGFGDSGSPGQNFHAGGQAKLILELLVALNLQEVHLIGFDFGGPVAVQLFRLVPERICTLTLANTNTFSDTPLPFPLKIAAVPVAGSLAFRVLFGKIGLKLMYWQAVADRQAFPYRQYVEALRSKQGIYWTRQIIYKSMRDLPGLYQEIESAQENINIPGLVIWGDRDPFFSLEQGRRTAAAIRGARFVQLKGCGHFVPEERAEEFARHVKKLITSFNCNETILHKPQENLL